MRRRDWRFIAYGRTLRFDYEWARLNLASPVGKISTANTSETLKTKIRRRYGQSFKTTPPRVSNALVTGLPPLGNTSSGYFRLPSQSGGRKMNQSSHDSAYRSAMKTAMDELGLINEEATSIRNRMDQLDLVLETLKPFLITAGDRRQISKSIESTAEPKPAPQTTGSALSDVAPPKMSEATDPIQRRINSVLGLAVA